MDSKFLEYFPQGLLPGKTIPYAHKGDWAVHDVLPFLFEQVGAYHLRLATFNVSEDSLRTIFFMKDRGELISTHFLYDINIRRHKLDMILFSTSIADDIRVSSTHMKIILCENDNLKFVMMGSANMNKNMRHEAGIFSTDDEMYLYYKNYFQQVFYGDSEPFLF